RRRGLEADRLGEGQGRHDIDPRPGVAYEAEPFEGQHVAEIAPGGGSDGDAGRGFEGRRPRRSGLLPRSVNVASSRVNSGGKIPFVEAPSAMRFSGSKYCRVRVLLSIV